MLRRMLFGLRLWLALGERHVPSRGGAFDALQQPADVGAERAQEGLGIDAHPQDARRDWAEQPPLTHVEVLHGCRTFRAGDPEKKIDFGVLGAVHRPGTVTVGDQVTVVGFADAEAEGHVERPESVIA